ADRAPGPEARGPGGGTPIIDYRRYPLRAPPGRIPPSACRRTGPGRRTGSLLRGELAVLEHGVDQSVVAGLLGGEDLVAVGVLADLIGVLAGMERQRLLHRAAHALDLRRLDLQVRDLTLHALG